MQPELGLLSALHLCAEPTRPSSQKTTGWLWKAGCCPRLHCLVLALRDSSSTV